GVAWVNPFEQPDYKAEEEPPLRIAVPNMLSILATRDVHGYVPGVNELLNGYTAPDGKVEPSVEEKMARGKLAITALADYRKAMKEGDKANAQNRLQQVNENMKYFGYGYIEKADDVVPYIPICFWAFRVMVGVGSLLILCFLVILFFVYKKDIEQFKWLQLGAICLLPLAYIASEAGWIVAELGRQPWTIQDLLPVNAAVSDISAGSIALTFFIFLALFTTLLCVEINILCKQIKKGPQL
ncbi:MAG: cytochrome ubiquinol oxidase subunit I, partial [Bacteroidaceae bacterium]|nr:cytochrome ubiquinol oxidase subunit I [Bacteroidaceae bacterium]